jgi:NAD(P)-dependent dehydrogenase (short-subunit alcohol dehydrogenase family)
MPPPSLPSQVALITGAGSGIGRATAVLLAARGWELVLVGRREEKLKETCSVCGLASARVLGLAADLADPAQAGIAVERALERFGRLDALVNNAGLAPRLPIGEHTPELIEEVYAVNALAPAQAIARAWPAMVRQGSDSGAGGCIVNISTMGTIDPFPGFFAYASAKAAVNLQVLCAAREGAPHGIRAFAIAPGAVETEMFRKIATEQEFPRSRTLTPESVAQVVLDCIEGRRDAENGGVITMPTP